MRDRSCSHSSKAIIAWIGFTLRKADGIFELKCLPQSFWLKHQCLVNTQTWIFLIREFWIEVVNYPLGSKENEAE